MIPSGGFSTRQVATFTGATLRQLQWWDERRLVIPRREGHLRSYRKEDVVELMVVSDLRGKGLSIQKIRRLIRMLRGGSKLRNVAGGESYLVTNGRLAWVVPAENLANVASMARGPIYVSALSSKWARVPEIAGSRN